jgi:hypothetical protein
MCPREESNLYFRLRRPMFYPLNYGDKLRSKAIQLYHILSQNQENYYFSSVEVALSSKGSR